MSPARKPTSPSTGTLRRLPVTPDEEVLLRGLRSGEPWARAAFFDRHGPRVERVVRRVLGFELHVDFADVVHDAFVEALASIESVRDAQALPAWVNMIAVRAAYKAMRTRRARRWLRFLAPADIPEVSTEGVSPELVEAHRRTYKLLSAMPSGEALAFALRYIEGMELTETAAACQVSLATIKRHLKSAEARFVRAARNDEVLRTWLEEGAKWSP